MKIAIIGAGKLGLKAAEALLSGDNDVCIVDIDENRLSKISSQMDVMTINANAKDLSTLKSMNIESYDYLIASTDYDEINMFVTSFAKKMGCSNVIARIRDPEHMKQFGDIKEHLGIDHIVNPDMDITVEIHKYLIEKYSLSNGFFATRNIALCEFKAKRLNSLVGMSLERFRELNESLLIPAISRNGKIIIPKGDTILKENDDLYVIGSKKDIVRLKDKVHESGVYTDIQKVMIIGGGKTGFYLAEKLSESGIAVKIIEKSKERCQYLSRQLKNVMILNGDATDLNFLEEENVAEMDAFVTATGYDEENLLLALTAKKEGVEDVIAKISRESYQDLIESIGIDMALNSLDISVANILRFMKGSKRILTSAMIQGQAEMIEIIVTEGMNITKQPLEQLQIPEGAIIAAIQRGQEIIIPQGSTKIKAGDRIIILSLLSELKNMENFLRGSNSPFLWFFNR